LPAIPHSTLAQWEEATDVQLQPLVDALRDLVLSHQVVYADKNTGVDARAWYE
jgi:transposase